jgi:hypothetical protein
MRSQSRCFVTVPCSCFALEADGVVAWVVFRLLGLRLLRQSWVNFELLWGALLVVVGAIALALAVQERAA